MSTVVTSASGSSATVGSSTGISGTTTSGTSGSAGTRGSSTTSSVGDWSITVSEVAINAIATKAPMPLNNQKFRPSGRGLSTGDVSVDTGGWFFFFSLESFSLTGAGIRAKPAASSPRASERAACARSWADAGRPSGFLAMHDITRARTAEGIEDGSSGGVSLIWAIAMATWDSPRKGRFPARAS